MVYEATQMAMDMVSGLDESDLIGLRLLTNVLGLWFTDPSWVRIRADDGNWYVHVGDSSGDLGVIIAQDETGSFGVETTTRYRAPDVTGSTVASVAMQLAQHYVTQWMGIGRVGMAMIKETRRMMPATFRKVLSRDVNHDGEAVGEYMWAPSLEAA